MYNPVMCASQEHHTANATTTVVHAPVPLMPLRLPAVQEQCVLRVLLSVAHRQSKC